MTGFKRLPPEVSMTYKGMVIYTPSGLFCPAGNFYLDPSRPVPEAIITHAHADHANPFSLQMWCTEPTSALVRLRNRNKATGRFREQPFGEPFRIRDVEITLLPAGHMLGSAQVLLDDGRERWLYTGDFKLQSDPTAEAYQFCKADVLITETTFADPAVRHPDPAGEIRKIREMEGRNIIVAAYSMGKAQRLCRLLAEQCPERLVMVHPDIGHFNRLYESFGMDLGAWTPYQAAAFKQIRHGIYLAPPYHFRNFRRSQKHILAFASGWEKLQLKHDLKLMISDHADWEDILRVVDFCSPKKIYTLHGEGKMLRDAMAARGLETARFN